MGAGQVPPGEAVFYVPSLLFAVAVMCCWEIVGDEESCDQDGVASKLPPPLPLLLWTLMKPLYRREEPEHTLPFAEISNLSRPSFRHLPQPSKPAEKRSGDKNVGEGSGERVGDVSPVFVAARRLACCRPGGSCGGAASWHGSSVTFAWWPHRARLSASSSRAELWFQGWQGRLSRGWRGASSRESRLDTETDTDLGSFYSPPN